MPLLLFWGLLIFGWPHGVRFSRKRFGKFPALEEFRGNLTSRQRANIVFLLWALSSLRFSVSQPARNTTRYPGLPGWRSWSEAGFERETIVKSRKQRAARRTEFPRPSAYAGVLISAVGAALLAFAKTPAPGVDLADLLRKNPADYALSFGHFLDLTPQAMGAFRTAAVRILFRISGGHSRELVLPPAKPGSSGQFGIGADDGRRS